MKINQIVSEHKKGVKARGYTKKGPEPRTVAKQAPQGVATAFAGQVAKEDAAQQVYKVTKSDPNTGLTLSKPDGTQLILPPDKMNAIASNPNDPNKYLLNPDAITQQATSGQPSGPEIGREVEVNADMNPEQAFGEEMDDAGDVGGDATDAYIDNITDHDFEQAQGRLRELAGMPPAISTMPTVEFVKGIYAAAAENGMAAPEVEAVKKQMVLAPNGEVDIIATMQKAVQVFQSPEWKQMLADLEELVKRAEAQPMEETNDQDMAEGEKKGLYHNVNLRKKKGISRDASSPKAPTAQAWKDAAKTAKKESMSESTADDKLLQKMLNIAGLR